MDNYETNKNLTLNLTTYDLRFLSEFKNLFRMSMNNLNNIGVNSKDQDFVENCHVILSFKIKCGERILDNEIIFIRLADSCRVSSKSKNPFTVFLNILGSISLINILGSISLIKFF